MSEASITSLLPLRLLDPSSVWHCRGATPEVVVRFLRIFWDRVNPLRGPARFHGKIPHTSSNQLGSHWEQGVLGTGGCAVGSLWCPGHSSACTDIEQFRSE